MIALRLGKAKGRCLFQTLYMYLQELVNSEKVKEALRPTIVQKNYSF
jgi:hypothetical protein